MKFLWIWLFCLKYDKLFGIEAYGETQVSAALACSITRLYPYILSS